MNIILELHRQRHEFHLDAGANLSRSPHAWLQDPDGVNHLLQRRVLPHVSMCTNHLFHQRTHELLDFGQLGAVEWLSLGTAAAGATGQSLALFFSPLELGLGIGFAFANVVGA